MSERRARYRWVAAIMVAVVILGGAVACQRPPERSDGGTVGGSNGGSNGAGGVGGEGPGPGGNTVALVEPGGDLCLASFAAPGTAGGSGASTETVDEGGGDIIGLAWSPDGATLGCVRIRDDETRVARLYRVEGGKTDAGEALDLPADQPLCDLSWSPDGKYLAVDVGTGGGGRTLFILDAQTRRGLSVVGYAWG
jgi:hypothetical protein